MCCICPSAALLDEEDDDTRAQQSRQATLVRSSSFPAGADTETPLASLRFHQHISVLVCCWSRKQILLCMKFNTRLTHESRDTRLLGLTHRTEACSRPIGLSPSSMLFSRDAMLHLKRWHILTLQIAICSDFRTEPALLHSPSLTGSA